MRRCAQGPGAREERLGLVACVASDGAGAIDRAVAAGGALHFEFYRHSRDDQEAAAAAGAATEDAAAADAGKLQVHAAMYTTPGRHPASS